MIDSIKSFFQSMYDNTFGVLGGWFESFSTFLSDSFTVILILAGIALAVVLFKLLKYVTVPMILISQIAMLSVVITSMIAFVALLATSLVSIYNKIFDLTSYISSASGVSCLSTMLDCLSVTGVLSVFMTELFALFIVVLLIRMSGLFLWAMDIISEKIWRIGVLLGLV